MSFTNPLIESYRLKETTIHDDHIEHVVEEDDDDRVVRWYKKQRLGAGGGSEAVWLEWSENVGGGEELRAVKQIRSSRDLTNKLRCSRELLAMVTFKGRRFVQLLGWFESRDYIYIAMQYFPEGDLESHLNDDARLPENEARVITRQVLEGLKVMHSKKFTHRDIKPKNLFVYRPGPNWHIKIGDFGISKLVESNDTALRTMDYSPGYGAPEIVDIYSDRETSDYTNAVDIWCVGVTVFRMLTTKLPFSDNRMVVEYANGRFPFPFEVLRSHRCSPQASIFVQRLLTDIAAQRPSADGALELPWCKGSDSLASAASSQPPKGRAATRPTPAWDDECRPQRVDSGTSQDFQRPDDDDRTITSAGSWTMESKSRDAGLDMLARQMGSANISTERPSPSLPRFRSVTFLSQATEQPLGWRRDSLAFNDVNLWQSYPRLARILDSRPTSLEGLAFDNGDGKPLLWWAAASGDLAIASEILNMHGIDVNAREETHGWTGLAKSVIDGNVDVCQLMLQHPRININQNDNDWGLTPLIIAAADGHVTIVELLLRHRSVDVDLRDRRWGRTALSWAAGRGRLEVVRILLEKARADITVRDFEGKSPLSWAVDAANLPLVEFLHSFQPEDSMAGDLNGRTPLWEAARKGHTAVVKFLVTTAPGQSLETDHLGRTPLIAAAAHGHVEIVSELLFPDLNGNFMRSNPRWKDQNGQNALICAAKSGNHDTVHRILMGTPPRERKILVDEEDNYDRSALSWSAAKGHISVARTLLHAGSRATGAPDVEGQLPLHKAVMYGHEDLAITLLRRDPLTADVKDNAGRTPLSWAAQNGLLQLLRILLASGVDVNSYDGEGWTVAYWAAVFGHKSCLEEMFSHANFEPYDPEGHTLLTRIIAKGNSKEANYLTESWFWRLPNKIVDFPDARGRTPLSWAAEKGHQEFVRLLLEVGQANPSVPDGRTWTPMSYAIFEGHELIALWLYGRQNLDPIDRQRLWNYKPRWAVKDEIISKMFPGMPQSLPGRSNMNFRRSLIKDARLLEDDDFSNFTKRDQTRARRLFSKLLPAVRPEASQADAVDGRQNLLRDAQYFGDRNFAPENAQWQVRFLIHCLFISRRDLAPDAISVHGPEAYERMYTAGWNIHMAKHSQDLSATHTQFVYGGLQWP